MIAVLSLIYELTFLSILIDGFSGDIPVLGEDCHQVVHEDLIKHIKSI